MVGFLHCNCIEGSAVNFAEVDAACLFDVANAFKEFIYSSL